MGCGTSSQKFVRQDDDPPISPISVSDTELTYPRASPPPNSKNDIYNPSDYASLDARVEQEQHKVNTSSYQALISTLTAGCTTELQKIRAIFVWLYLQDIHGSFYSQVTDPRTPKGYMKLMKTQNGSYEAFFAQLCRAAGIPCSIIRGIGKGDSYIVGQQNTSRLDSSWNAVFVAGGWRLVHPLWAFFQEKQNYENGVRPHPGTRRASIQEFFWLQDPERFICFCKPQTDEWQLLKTKCDQKKFLSAPQFTEEYFDSGLMLPKKYSGVMQNEGGVFVLEFDQENKEKAKIDAQVGFDEDLPRDVNMKDYMAICNSTKTKKLAIRFPVRGWYTLDVYGGVNNRKPKIVRFRVECQKTAAKLLPFPFTARDGFGVLEKASNFGISEAKPENGILLVQPNQERQFIFTTSQRLEGRGTLYHINHDPDRFKNFVSTNSTSNQLQINVTVPDEAHLEFGLKIEVRAEKEGDPWHEVANYLLVDENWQKTVVTVAKPKNNQAVRDELVAATKDENIARLEKAIDEFQRENLEDNGDLTRARERLVQLHLENLKRATKERQLEDLETAIDAAHKSNVSPYLEDSKELADAELARQQLTRMKLYLHRVLSLSKPTIHEIHSYQRPRPLVHQVMKATFRILGEPDSRLQSWPYVQSSMRQLGRNNMLARMRRCDVIDLHARQVDDAERYLSETDKRSVRMCSAGAGTFYVWSNNMIAEYQGKGENNDQMPRNNIKENGPITKRTRFNDSKNYQSNTSRSQSKFG